MIISFLTRLKFGFGVNKPDRCFMGLKCNSEKCRILKSIQEEEKCHVWQKLKPDDPHRTRSFAIKYSWPSLDKEKHE